MKIRKDSKSTRLGLGEASEMEHQGPRVIIVEKDESEKKIIRCNQVDPEDTASVVETFERWEIEGREERGRERERGKEEKEGRGEEGGEEEGGGGGVIEQENQ